MADRTREYASRFVDFLTQSVSPYHTTAQVKARLEAAGFERLQESLDWTLQPGGKYYVTRNASSIIAFTVPPKAAPMGFAVVGTHTDSPTLRLKPNSKKLAEGYIQVAVETYGGGLWHTWFDRDLSVAGRVMAEVDGNITQRLVCIDKPLLRIPNLAIHLNRDANVKFEFNKETQLLPVAGLVSAQLDLPTEPVRVADDGMDERHSIPLLKLIASEAKLDSITQIKDFELILYDTHKPSFLGLHDEFIVSQRLDNLGMTFAAVTGLVESLQTIDPADSTIRMIACFDHEEIGSVSAQGAASNFMPSTMQRIFASLSNRTFEQAVARSFVISADMAHAVHPNYASKYEAEHKPAINGGTVIKVNANQRYVTNSPGIVLLKKVAELTHSRLQTFVVRNDSSCGSTIGPGLSALTGIRTLDLGNPQLSMHSIREMSGVADVENACHLFSGFFSSYGDLEPTICVDTA